jgi:hypothetical protein
MNWVCDHLLLTIVWFVLALCCSIYWGVYGCNDVKNENNKDKNRERFENIKTYFLKNKIEAIGIFMSEFIWSFLGWIALYILIQRFPDKLGNFDIFLGTIAVIGITGYASLLSDKIGKF